MAFDFPNSPSVGQRVTGVGGIVYVWDGVKWASNIGSVTAQSMGDVGRNLIHNPLFNVAQRGAGPFTASAYTLDRWFIAASFDTFNINQTVLVDANRTQIGDEAATYCLNNVFVGSANVAAYNQLIQKIEDVRRLAGKTVTVSFWALANVAATKLGVSLTQDFGSGGSPSATVAVNGQAVTLTSSFTRYSLTFTVPSAAGKTLGANSNHNTWLQFWYSAGANNAVASGSVGVQSATVFLWGVQLEVGSVATQLEKPDLRYDLANCNRFFQVVVASIRASAPAAGAIYDCTVSFQSMRTIPTIGLVSAGSQGNVSVANLVAVSSNYCARFEISSTAGGDCYALNTAFGLTADL